MKAVLLALAVAAGSLQVVPAFAQTVDTMTCADFAAQDDAGKMATAAELQAATGAMMAAEADASETLDQLTANCAGHDDMMLTDAMGEM
jgi:hypothetical protein